MTKEEKDKLLQLIFSMRKQTIENEAKVEGSNKETAILQRLKIEISGFQKVMESNDIEAQKEKLVNRQNWQMFHEGKVDAYGLIISVLKEIIKDYDGENM